MIVGIGPGTRRTVKAVRLIQLHHALDPALQPGEAEDVLERRSHCGDTGGISLGVTHFDPRELDGRFHFDLFVGQGMGRGL